MDTNKFQQEISHILQFHKSPIQLLQYFLLQARQTALITFLCIFYLLFFFQISQHQFLCWYRGPRIEPLSSFYVSKNLSQFLCCFTEAVEPPPKTYITKDKFEYFKPCVQVEMDNPDKQDTVTEVFVRGWKIDDPMMNVFKCCLTRLDRLTTIK